MVCMKPMPSQYPLIALATFIMGFIRLNSLTVMLDESWRNASNNWVNQLLSLCRESVSAAPYLVLFWSGEHVYLYNRYVQKKLRCGQLFLIVSWTGYSPDSSVLGSVSWSLEPARKFISMLRRHFSLLSWIFPINHGSSMCNVWVNYSWYMVPPYCVDMEIRPCFIATNIWCYPLIYSKSLIAFME